MNRFGRMAFLTLRWRRQQRPRVGIRLRYGFRRWSIGAITWL